MHTILKQLDTGAADLQHSTVQYKATNLNPVPIMIKIFKLTAIANYMLQMNTLLQVTHRVGEQISKYSCVVFISMQTFDVNCIAFYVLFEQITMDTVSTINL